MDHRGLAPIVLIIIAAIVIVSVGGYLALRQKAPISNDSTAESQTSQPTVTTTQATPDAVPATTPAFDSNPTVTPPAIERKESAEVAAAIGRDGSARVIVGLRGNEFTSPDYHNDIKKNEEVRKIQNRVLATLTPADWSNTKLFDYIPSFAGTLTKSGLDKLNLNPDVVSINLDRPVAPTSAN